VDGGIRVDSKELKIALELRKLAGCWRFKSNRDSPQKRSQSVKERQPRLPLFRVFPIEKHNL
jgi:hypothetical protein